MINLLLIALGGAIGASLRFLTGKAAIKLFGMHEVLTGTVFANIAGCLFAGTLLGLVSVEQLLNQTSILFLTIGILGSLTTFSTFILEAYQIGKASAPKLLTYLFLQLFVALLATVAGYGFIHFLNSA
ncbi:MAG: fluoride efflux transporter CrcB [Balneolaceae bacterium]|nr:MAG: fluoride efflux transporter CrcB [Balneolaceae bacterium]